MSALGPYCYANTLSMVVDEAWRPGLVETLTGSPFGFQMVGPIPLFDPAGWDPDSGLNQALTLLGWQSDRETFASAEEAFARLAVLCTYGAVFVGPLEMGLLLHQPGSDRPNCADDFVAVLDAGSDGVTMHDPQGHPYAWLPREAFMTAWGSDTIGYCTGRFPVAHELPARGLAHPSGCRDRPAAVGTPVGSRRPRSGRRQRRRAARPC